MRRYSASKVRLQLVPAYALLPVSTLRLYVTAKMEKRCLALAAEDSIPRGELKELAVISGIVSIFRATAGVVSWTGAELDGISKLWIRAFKRAWEYPQSMDSSPIIHDKADSGRACPSARAVWTEDTLTVLDQCIQLLVPGEISTLVLDHLRLACSSRGCVALSQLQRVIRVDGTADSIVELLSLRLVEQGTDLSTPWPQEPGRLILDVMWPQVKEAWRTKQEWKGCTELTMAVQKRWEQAKFSLKMCRLLGNIGILYHLHQLQTTAGRSLRWEEIRTKQCAITKAEYSQLISHLQREEERMSTSECEGGGRVPGQYQLPAPQHLTCYPIVRDPTRLPPCLAGKVCSTASCDRFVLAQCQGEMSLDIKVSQLSDSQLMDQMCQARAVFHYSDYTTMDLIQGIWRPWLGLEKRDFKFTGTGASTSVPSVYNIINHFLFLFQSKSLNLEMLRLLRRMLPSSSVNI